MMELLNRAAFTSRSQMGEFDSEGRAFADAGGDGQGSLVEMNDLAGEGQPDAVPFGIFFIGAAVEGGEDIIDILR